jgi:cation transport ATPase
MAKRLALVLQLLCLVAGGLLQLVSKPEMALQAWSAGTVVALGILVAEVARNALKGNFALDIIAAIAMFTALALGQAFAGIIIATMYLGGQLLEDLASRRVGREMKALLERAPRFANRFSDEHIETIDVATVKPGDRLLVRRGDIVPVDGNLLSAMAALDQSSVTGEALGVKLERGGLLMSGVTNASDAFEMRATQRRQHLFGNRQARRERTVIEITGYEAG